MSQSQGRQGADDSNDNSAVRKAERSISTKKNAILGIFPRAVALAVLVIILSREDFALKYGAGTGKNKAHLNPLSVVTYVAFNEKLASKNVNFWGTTHVSWNDYPAARRLSQELLVALATPGELLQDIRDYNQNKRSTPLDLSEGPKKLWDRWNKRTRNWMERKVKSDAAHRAILNDLRQAPEIGLFVSSLAMILSAFLGTLSMFPPSFNFVTLGMNLVFMMSAASLDCNVAPALMVSTFILGIGMIIS